MTEQSWATVATVARALGVHQSTVYRWLDAGTVEETEVAGQRCVVLASLPSSDQVKVRACS